MLNRTLIKPSDAIDFIHSKLVYEPLKKDIIDKNSVISKLIIDTLKHPFWTYEPEKVERTQFSSWWRHFQIRQYDNPYIGDLYLIHEFVHMQQISMFIQDFDVEYTFNDWAKQTIDNEIYASIVSEAQIYGIYPELRKLTFKNKIWADQFSRKELFDYKLIVHKRLETMVLGNFSDNDFDKVIAKYHNQNIDWCNIWKNSSQIVEVMLYEFFMSPYDKQIEQMDRFIEMNGLDGLMFHIETYQFADYVKDNIINLHKV